MLVREWLGREAGTLEMTNLIVRDKDLFHHLESPLGVKSTIGLGLQQTVGLCAGRDRRSATGLGHAWSESPVRVEEKKLARKDNLVRVSVEQSHLPQARRQADAPQFYGSQYGDLLLPAASDEYLGWSVRITCKTLALSCSGIPVYDD